MSGFASYPRAATWLYGKLTSPAIAGVAAYNSVAGAAVFEDEAPQAAMARADTWIEYEVQAPGQDVAEVAEQRIWTEFVFLVRAVSRGRSTEALKAIADEIDNRLHRQSGTVSDGQVISSTRQQEHQGRTFDSIGGVEYRELGGFYSLIVQTLNP